MKKNILTQNLSKKFCLAVLFLCLNLLNVSAQTGSNQTDSERKFTIQLDDTPIAKVFEHVEKNSNFIFIYDDKTVDKRKPVSLNCKNATIKQVLDLLFKDMQVSYVIDKRQIILKKADTKEKNTSTPSPTKKVTGIVYDPLGEPLAGALIQIEGTTSGVTTGLDGNYSIDVKPNDKLIYSFLGFDTKTIAVGQQDNIVVRLEEKSNALEEVTVVAFGKQKKESVIGSITTVTPSELKVPSSNLTTSLAGRVAGLISYQRSGEPGQDNAEFFIRGVTTFGYKVDPLILIDNVEVTTTDLARLQPDDIQSFSIMKDATSTALYGARGANGVILITTKSGKEGKVKVNFRVENSISTATKDVEFVDPITYMRLHNEAALTRNPLAPLPYSQSKIDNTIAGTNPYVYPATDWKNTLMKDYTMNQRVNLSLSGGGNVARYFVAGSFSNDNGNLKAVGDNNFNNNISLQNFSLRSNVNINVTKTTELIVRLNGSFDDYTGPLFGGKNVYEMIVKTNPVLFPPSYPASVSPGVQHVLYGNAESENGGLYLNPYAQLTRGYKDYSRSKMMAQVELSQDLDFITKGLSFRGLVNTTRSSYFDVLRYYDPFYYNVASYDKKTDTYTLNPLNADKGKQSLSYDESEKTVKSIFYLEAALNYNRTFKEKHALGGLLVFNMREELDANAGSLQLSLPSRNIGLAGRFTYGYDSRYFIEGNFGYNGSERFSKNHRFGFFPSFGLGWSVSNESFWEPYKNVVNNLKIRGTYGLVGNDAIGEARDRFYYLSNVEKGTGAKFGTDNGYSREGIKITRYSNDEIKWEVSRKANLALEMGLFDKLNIIAEYFYEYRSNILMARSGIPVSMGLSATIKSNLGEASSRGTDISVDYSHFINKDFWIQGRGNFTYATSKYEVYEETPYDEPWRSRIGHPIKQEWMYIAERLFVDEEEVANSPTQFGNYMAGDIKYRDVNGDGKITEADMVPAGYPTTPEISYGFGISAGYKKFDFSVFFQGTARQSFRIGITDTAPFINRSGSDANKYLGENYQSNNQMLKAYADSHWSEDNRDVYALWPRLSVTSIENNTQRSTWFLRDGSFLRLKQLELGYTFSHIIKGNKSSNLRLYASATNLLCWSKFKLWDPEMASDGLGYPIQRVFNVGLSVSF